jgi:hypothetical protein
VGLATWIVHRAAGWDYFLDPWFGHLSLRLPVSIAATGLCLMVFLMLRNPSPTRP